MPDACSWSKVQGNMHGTMGVHARMHAYVRTYVGTWGREAGTSPRELWTPTGAWLEASVHFLSYQSSRLSQDNDRTPAQLLTAFPGWL